MSELALTNEELAACDNVDCLLDALWTTSFDMLANIERLAVIIGRLDQLGAKVEFDSALLPYIRMVSQGKLLGECLVALSGDPLLLEQATMAPIETQRQLAAGYVNVWKDGDFYETSIFELTDKEIPVVFDKGRIRSPEEQRDFLHSRSTSKRSIAVKAVHRERKMREGNRPHYESGNLATHAGEVISNSKRCESCGAKLLPTAECLSCKLKTGDVADLEQERIQQKLSKQSPISIDDGDDDEGLPDGWEQRLAELRSAKDSCHEVKFHADWIVARIAKGQLDPEDEESLSLLFDCLCDHHGIPSL